MFTSTTFSLGAMATVVEATMNKAKSDKNFIFENNGTNGNNVIMKQNQI